MPEAVAATCCSKHVGGDCSGVKCRMIGEHVHKYLDIIFACAVTHGLELVTCTELIVAHLPVDRLIVVVPFALYGVTLLAEEGHAAVLTDETCIGRRGLHVFVTGLGYILHIVGNGRERP